VSGSATSEDADPRCADAPAGCSPTHEVERVQTIEQLHDEIDNAKDRSTVERVRWLLRGQSRPYPKGWELLPRVYRRSAWVSEAGVSALAMDAYCRKREKSLFHQFRERVEKKPELLGLEKGGSQAETWTGLRLPSTMAFPRDCSIGL